MTLTHNGNYPELQADALARFNACLVVAERWAMIDGDHHKQWTIDQMLRALLGDGPGGAYRAWRDHYDEVARRDDYQEWDEGIAP